ncbi:MAG TPA: DMT family transporter [Longimicrobiaceae bacterium]|nr:DMT family transporter [Longimicrobiaceae bacterium]
MKVGDTPRARQAPDPLLEASTADATAPVPSPRGTELSLAVMVIVWAVNFSVVKRALDVFNPLAFNALRYVLASLFVLAVLRLRGPIRWPTRHDFPRFLLVGILGNVLYQLAFIYGINYTRAGNASVMMALTPLVVALLSWRVGHEQPGPLTWFGGACSLMGVALVSGASLRVEGTATTLLGDLILVGAVVLWALYTVAARGLILRYGSVMTTAWTMWLGGAVLVLVGIPSMVTQEWSAVHGVAWGGLAYSAFLSIGLSYLIWYRAVERIGSTRTSIYSNLTPAVALIVAAVWLGERLTLFSILGALLTIGGVMLVRSDPGSRRPVAQGD